MSYTVNFFCKLSNQLLSAPYHIAISYIEQDQLARAQNYASKLKLPLVARDSTEFAYQLLIEANRLSVVPALKPKESSNNGSISIDFDTGKNKHRLMFGGGKNQAVARAVGFSSHKNLHILDATAGFGGDAIVFASLGAKVSLLERNKILHVLLKDALMRGLQATDMREIVERITLHHTDAIEYLQNLSEELKPDVIYLDPMYPDRQKSASVKKNMQLLHHIIGPDTDSEELLKIARKKALKRVVVKRPKSATPISDIAISGVVKSSNTRYDIYSPE